ncbi:MAG: tetratricopeptide repeat protein [Halofilum sp. (in: g-proteobacteria)]|nr:tetratricopeptide repeat protein [Halofilum sp. (in: g-proteobacteria)]
MARGPRGPGLRPVILICLLLLAVVSVPALAATADEAFQAGVAASREGDHREAVERFEAARRAGLDTSALHFNLGVAYYRLGELERARESFRRAYRAGDMAAPAAYNLGRIAREQGDIAAARRWFRRAVDRARTDAVRAQARRALSDLGVAVRDSLGLVSLGVGYDSNVQLAPEESADVSRESDLFASAQLYGRRGLGDGAYLYGGGYTEQYLDEDDFSLLSLAGGAGWRGTGDTRPHARIGLRHTRFGGDAFQDTVLARAGVTWRLGRDSLRAGLRVDSYDGASGFGYLDGDGVGASLQWEHVGANASWSLEADVEQIDRADSDAGNDFFSLSYEAVALDVERTRQLGGSARLRLSAGWKGYRYDDPEVRDGSALERRREDRLKLGMSYEAPLEGGWWWTGGIDATHRESNIDEFGYDRVRATFGVERLF